MAIIKGNRFANTLTGTSGRDIIEGLDGDDTIFAGGGNDLVFGGDGDDKLFGEAGNDQLFGGKGTDLIEGGAGNDFINGGRGVDTATFNGDYDDYTIVTKRSDDDDDGDDDDGGQGNFKLIVKDTVAGRDGTDTVQHVEFLQFQDATVNVTSGDVWSYAVNTAPDASAIDPLSPGNLYAGNGIPATNFGTARNEGAGIELGLQVIYRQGPSVATADDYSDGVLHFAVNDGPQSTTNGSFLNNANRAAWSFEYSIVTGLNGETTNLEPIREVLESDESDVIPCWVLDSRWSARCGHLNTAWRRSAAAFVTRAI
jgi:hypothetical protein